MSGAIQEVENALSTGAVCRVLTIEALRAGVGKIASLGNNGSYVDRLFENPNRAKYRSKLGM